jgi:hypothetical protein
MCKKLIPAIFVPLIAAFIAFTVIAAPVKIIHPDALRFMAIFQQQYETVNSISGIPGAIFHGIESANKYDFYRGRITNYVTFALEAMTRSYLPFPFISWLTMAVLVFNAALCARLVTRDLTSPLIRRTLFFLAMLILLMNPLFIASYEMQFIYSKYLCVTFILLFMSFNRSVFRGGALVGAVFSDEIGLAFAMIAVFLMVLNKKSDTGRSESLTLARLFKTVALGIIAAFTVLLLYFCTLQLFFHHIAHYIQHGGFEYYVPINIVFQKSIEYLVGLTSMSVGFFGIALIILLTLFLTIKKIQIFRSFNGWRRQGAMLAQLTNRQFQEMGVGIFLALFIVFKMYRGDAGMFYYGYPVFMLLMFVGLSQLVNAVDQRIAIIALAVFVMSLILHLPDGLALLKSEVASTWIVDKTVSMGSFNSAEATIKGSRSGRCIANFDAIHNGMDNDFEGTDYSYGEKYFPIKGIVKVLSWPHSLSRCTTTN